MKKYFELCDKLEFDNHEWKSYFFSEVSALAYHEGKVHMGFKIELRKLWNDISGILNRRTKQQIWITGHSLGGAMATLCASRLEERNPILYTYGSPRVGGREWRDGCDVEHHRFRNNNDVVPVVPLWLMGYRHHGKLCYINYYGNIRKLTLWQKLKDSMRGRWKALKKFQLFDGIYDHNITLYSDKLKDLYAYTGKILIK